MRDKVSIGIDDFKKLRERQYCYIDKTMLVHELMENATDVTLFTRPRRFGKTLNMTMLREFFDCTKESKLLFENLLIAQSESYKYMNAFPTLFFSFKECKGSRNGMIRNIFKTLLTEYDKYSFICDSLSDTKKKRYYKIVDVLTENIFDEAEGINDAIEFLASVVAKYYNKSVILLIDEYDTPLESSYIGGFYEEVHAFISGLYSSALKGNACIEKGVLTGIQRVSKESIFSGLNNLLVESVIDRDFNEYFGFTQQEVNDLLQANDMSFTREVKAMYNGYNFGGMAIYNPWSVINYVKKKRLDAYWINTANNERIKELILQYKDDVEYREAFEHLLVLKEARVPINMTTIYHENESVGALWALLLHAGYITPVDEVQNMDEYITIRVPNLEVRNAFKEIVPAYTNIKESSLKALFEYLIVRQDMVAFEMLYQQMVYTTTSFYDSKENAYHMLFLGMCIYLDGYYEVKSNLESGDGRSDITLKALRPEYKHFVIEFKQGENLAKLASEAVEQIKLKNYTVGLKGEIVLLGVAHNKKRCEVLAENIRNL